MFTGLQLLINSMYQPIIGNLNCMTSFFTGTIELLSFKLLSQGVIHIYVCLNIAIYLKKISATIMNNTKSVSLLNSRSLIHLF